MCRYVHHTFVAIGVYVYIYMYMYRCVCIHLRVCVLVCGFPSLILQSYFFRDCHIDLHCISIYIHVVNISMYIYLHTCGEHLNVYLSTYMWWTSQCISICEHLNVNWLWVWLSSGIHVLCVYTYTCIHTHAYKPECDLTLRVVPFLPQLVKLSSDKVTNIRRLVGSCMLKLRDKKVSSAKDMFVM
jgi:hypothetical protein